MGKEEKMRSLVTKVGRKARPGRGHCYWGVMPSPCKNKVGKVGSVTIGEEALGLRTRAGGANPS